MHPYNLGEEYNRLRDYQLECVTSVFDTFNGGASSTIAVLPMSAGKTVIVGAIISRYLEKQPLKKTVMLSHLDILTKQNEESLREFWSLKTGILQGLEMPSRNKNCIISTMQSFSKKDKRDYWGCMDDVGLVVIDEAHLYGSDSYDKIVESLPRECVILGVTATPFRENKDMTSMFENVSYTISMQELIDKGMLVPPVLHHFPAAKEEERIEIHKRMISIYVNKHKGEKSIIFLKSIKECESMENLFKSIGINAKAVTSKFTGTRRDQCIEDFKAAGLDSADVLITVNVLTAGFSSNNVRSIFMPYQINSVAAYLQRIGRGMRLDMDKDHVDIYVGGTSPELTQEKYVKMQRKALTAGQGPTQEDIEIEREEYEDTHDEDGVKYNQDTIDLANDLKKNGFEGLATVIKQQDFPAELLNELVIAKPAKSKKLSSQLITTSEAQFLARNGITAGNMNRLDAVYTVSAILHKKGIPKQSLYIQSGKHEGKPIQVIAPLQVKYMSHRDRQAYYNCRETNKSLYSILDSL